MMPRPVRMRPVPRRVPCGTTRGSRRPRPRTPTRRGNRLGLVISIPRSQCSFRMSRIHPRIPRRLTQTHRSEMPSLSGKAALVDTFLTIVFVLPICDVEDGAIHDITLLDITIGILEKDSVTCTSRGPRVIRRGTMQRPPTRQATRGIRTNPHARVEDIFFDISRNTDGFFHTSHMQKLFHRGIGNSLIGILRVRALVVLSLLGEEPHRTERIRPIHCRGRRRHIRPVRTLMTAHDPAIGHRGTKLANMRRGRRQITTITLRGIGEIDDHRIPLTPAAPAITPSTTLVEERLPRGTIIRIHPQLPIRRRKILIITGRHRTRHTKPTQRAHHRDNNCRHHCPPPT
ncbi:hypothetical protein PA08_1754 [Cutibacterium modestum P08]|nr:hypothetical protein PA08_1754 [Cutibacterium modestum P08]